MIEPGTTSLEDYLQDGSIAGGAMAATRRGELVFEHYVGEAAPGLPASPDVLWPLASISKCFTSALVMRLVADGELRLDTRVGSVLPDFTREGRDDVELRHLLSHTSGLRYESPDLDAHLRAHSPLDVLIDEACHVPQQFRTGTRFSYSDDGYLLAGHVAAVALGAPYATLVEELVIAPMGLRDACIVPPPAATPRLAHIRGVLAEGTDGAMYNSSWARSLAHPAFGAFATVHGLLRFGHHFAPGGPRIHDESTIASLTQSRSGDLPGKHPSMMDGLVVPIPWSYGFELQTAAFPELFAPLASIGSFGHGGASGCQLVVDPVQELVVVVFSNTHLLTGPVAWANRLRTLTDAAFAEAKRRT